MRRLRTLWAVVRYALGPAGRQTGRILNWLPVVAAVGSLAGIVAAVTGFTSQLSVEWWLVVSLSIMAVLFLRAAADFYSETHPDFPRHAINLGRLWYYDMENPATGNEERALILPLKFTNRERARRLSLHFDLAWQLDSGLWTAGPHTYSPVRRDPFLQNPVQVEPETTIDERLAFWSDDIGLSFHEPMEVAIKEDFTLTLAITDHVTGATIERPLLQPVRSPEIPGASS